MNFELFIARRLFGKNHDAEKVSRPAVTIAQAGVAIGIIVMTLSICIVTGFKNTLRDKIDKFGGHIEITGYPTEQYGEPTLTLTTGQKEHISAIEGVEKVQAYVQKAGLISVGKGEEFEGVVLKGIGSGYDNSFYASYIVEGEMPQFSDTARSEKIVIPQAIAQKLNISVGDDITIYFIQDNIKARPMSVAGIYNTHVGELDNLLAITDIYTTRRVNGWEEDKYSGVEITVKDKEQLEEGHENILSIATAIAEENGEMLYVQTAEEKNPSLFSWLEVLDSTVWIILVLVIGISGFTIIAGLLILILERASFIGTLKALGAQNFSVRKIFIYYALLIVTRGIVWGNVIGIALCLVQKHFRIVSLDPAMYYMESVPIEFTATLIPMNIAMFIIALLILILPSMLVSRIEPTKTMKFE